MAGSTKILVVVMGAIFLLAPLAIDMYLPAFPAIAASFATGIDEIEATVAIFLAGFALGQLFLGPISDAFGRRVVLLGGILVFIAATVLVATANTLEQLYIWRFVQALGAAGAVAVFPYVRDHFNATESTKVISYIMSVIIVAPVIAPILGGYVVITTGWRSIFWFVAGMGIISLLATVVFVRESRTERDKVSLTAMFSAYLAVLSERRIVLAVLSGGFAFAGLFAFIAGSPFVYITYFGVDPEYYGFLVSLNAVAMIGANLVNGRFLAGIDPVAKVYWGAVALAAASVGILLAVFLGVGLAPLAVLIAVFFTAMGMTETNAIIVALSIRPNRNGTVAALNGAFQFGVGAIASWLVSNVESTDELAMVSIMATSGVAVLFSAVALRRDQSSGGRGYLAAPSQKL